jgi:hypothetical protein
LREAFSLKASDLGTLLSTPRPRATAPSFNPLTLTAAPCGRAAMADRSLVWCGSLDDEVKDLLETCGWTIECVTGAARPPCLTRK